MMVQVVVEISVVDELMDYTRIYHSITALMSKKMVIPTSVRATSACSYEEEHVHAVYESIATHFSGTRYKRWPVVEAFLSSQPASALGLDAGTGNGKYLDHRMIGIDRSRALLGIAREKGEAVQSDVQDAIWRGRVFDFGLSIATLHHLATHERRVRALGALFGAVRSGGRVLVFVWAAEQGAESRRGVEAGWQDVLVPWGTGGAERRRYYHLFVRGELAGLVRDAAAEETRGVVVVQEGYEKSNYYVEIQVE